MYVGKQNDFKYHPRCTSMGMNRLCFADYLILFSKGDYKAVNMVLQGVELFAAITSLKANKNKCRFVQL